MAVRYGPPPVVTRGTGTTYHGPMTTLPFRLAIAIIGLVVSAASVFGQEGLYAPSVPEDAALVRVVNLHRNGDSPRLDMGRERFSPQGPGTVSPYRPVPPGIHILGGAGGVEFMPQPGRFYSVVFGPENALTLLSDEAHTDPARAQLVLYNFTDSVVDLVAVPGNTVILEGVAPDQSRSIAVNAISVSLVVRAGGEDLDRRELAMERGESYGVFATSRGVIIEAATVSSE